MSTWTRWNQPRTWAALYLLAIPCFACLYRLDLNGFYQSTGRYERPVQTSISEVERDIREALILQWPGKDTIEGEQVIVLPRGRRLLIDLLDVHDMRVNETGITFRVSGRLASSRDAFLAVTLGLSIDRNPVLYRKHGYEEDSFNDPLILHHVDTPISGPDSISFEDAFGWLNTDERPYFLVDRATGERLRNIYLAANGRVVGLPQGFERMLYLSAVTITTLGMGDIAPVSRTSRLLVGAESILGVVVMGLFLNSLFAQRRVNR